MTCQSSPPPTLRRDSVSSDLRDIDAALDTVQERFTKLQHEVNVVKDLIAAGEYPEDEETAQVAMEHHKSCIRLKREVQTLFRELQKRQRVVPCLRRKDFGRSLNNYNFLISLKTCIFTGPGDPGFLFKDPPYLNKRVANIIIKHACGVDWWPYTIDNFNDAINPVVLEFENNWEKRVTFEGANWVPLFNKRAAVSLQFQFGSPHMLQIGFHTMSTFAMAKLLSSTGDWGNGYRVTHRKLLEYLAVQAHSVDGDSVRRCAVPSYESRDLPLDRTELTTASTVTYALQLNFGNSESALSPQRNPFAVQDLLQRTRPHFKSLSARKKLRQKRKLILNKIKRLRRQIDGIDEQDSAQ
ncbi:hypothetical protein PTSG_03889 [Salpingoeca rosetta]|uniref:Uncharacterized protein n=1 Tax=Salpingoeca rosetta (strain ATCC 50818 / BSB-021) TaxID=946362 RepID=F2U5P3_SALR5|nr:uncharacterized protein PTSG_03889 [Salpingoeca rosetta]EGD83259.1 hypothetical protein PTSG_03889 [Salpingoeca rosetta]|eukprot:XP_004995623.1 hypothetical protein PTSG_03889 [Salpingoeca rosetta]